MLGNPRTTAPEPPRDRRTARREATKAEILEAAWALVREHGLAALSLRDLAARVGMRAPSLYQYFDSKHAIYDAMFRQGAQQALESIASDRPEGETRAVLREGAHRMFEFSTSDPARSQLLFQRTIPGFEPSRESYAPAVELVNYMQALFAAHAITHPDAFDTWTALVSGLTNQQLANDPGGDRYGRLVDGVVDMFLAHFAPETLEPKRKGKK